MNRRTAKDPADSQERRTAQIDDLLVDYLWMQEERIGNLVLGTRILADNGNLALNAVELLGGSPALATIRGNRSYQRPFDVVKQLEQEANDRYRDRCHSEQRASAATSDVLPRLTAQDAHGSVLDYLAVAYGDYAIRLTGQIGVVGDIEHGHALLVHPPKQIEHP